MGRLAKGCIEQRSGSWFIRYTLGGRTQRQGPYLTREAAELVQFGQPLPPEAPRPTLQVWFEQFNAQHNPTLRRVDRGSYADIFDKHCNVVSRFPISRKRLDDISPLDFDALWDSLSKKTEKWMWISGSSYRRTWHLERSDQQQSPMD